VEVKTMYNRILVPLDGSKLAECVIPHVINLAEEFKSREVILLRVCQQASILADYPADMPEPWEEHVKAINTYSTQQCGLYLDNIEKQLKDAGLKNIRTVGKLGDAAKEITEFADKADVDLIVMATHGRSGPGRWAYGSVAEKVTRATMVPVLTIKAAGCTVSI
jgi:nucleotide-binding universal stress UspA family protein